MSLVATTIVWAARIEPTPLKLTALALADWSNDEGGSLHPSMAAIAQKVCVSRSQAQRLVHQLIGKGLLSVVENARGGFHMLTPRYQLHLDRFAALAESDADADADAETGSTGATGRAHATGGMDATGRTHAAPAIERPAEDPATPKPRSAPPPRPATPAEATKPAASSQPAESRGSRLATDWNPTEEQLAFCRQHRPDLDPSEVADRFRDYWLAQPGAKGRKSDWLATWRNWVRNERRDARGGFTPSAPVANLLDTSEVFSEPLRRSR